jgi:hypothetical protein
MVPLSVSGTFNSIVCTVYCSSFQTSLFMPSHLAPITFSQSLVTATMAYPLSPSLSALCTAKIIRKKPGILHFIHVYFLTITPKKPAVLYT